jgi:hypothetical protein
MADDEHEIHNRQEDPELPVVPTAPAGARLLAQQPVPARALVQAAEDAGAAKEQETRGREQQTDEVPYPRHQQRMRAAIEDSQHQQVERERQQERQDE